MQCISKRCAAELPSDALFCFKCGRRQQAEKKYHKRANGAGTVYKLSGNRSKPWAAAKSGVLIGTYPTRAEALTALEKLSGQGLTEKYNMTFTNVFEAWKAEHYRELTERGKQGYDIAYKHFETIHNNKIRQLKAADYQKIVDARIDENKSRSSTEKDRQLIGQMCQWAMREEIIAVNYAQFIKLQEAPKQQKDIFTDKEIQLFSKAAVNNDAAKLVCMLLATGMRIGELFTLRTDDVFDRYCIGGEKTEAGRNRVIPIRPEGRDYFQYFKSRAGELLIEGYAGNRDPANFRGRDYYSLLNTLGISKKTPHATRHTYASRAVKEGMDRELLQRILGHASYSTTADIYVHSDMEKLIASVESVSNVLVTDNV